MARLQKKKPAAKKKKTGQSAEGAGETRSDTAGVQSARGTGAVTTEAAKEKKQKRDTPAAKKASPAGQSAVLRLVDRYFGNWIQFLREVKIELSKVTWPGRKQTIGSTIVVIVFVFLIALFLGAADIVLSSLMRLIL
ncbi:MAG: preprotein translocase subunit SecE [Desulfobacterales bacterium]|nr:preprotein translocase subunit SecE [Desulfobacterales bacterium]